MNKRTNELANKTNANESICKLVNK